MTEKIRSNKLIYYKFMFSSQEIAHVDMQLLLQFKIPINFWRRIFLKVADILTVIFIYHISIIALCKLIFSLLNWPKSIYTPIIAGWTWQPVIQSEVSHKKKDIMINTHIYIYIYIESREMAWMNPFAGHEYKCRHRE